MNLYDVDVSALYRVGADSEAEARINALEIMRLELIDCPENLGDFKTVVNLREENV